MLLFFLTGSLAQFCTINLDIQTCKVINQYKMNYPKPQISGPEASIIQTILEATAEVATFLRHSPIIEL